MTTISATMMVKNEAANLPRCLAALKKLGVIDEIVVTDTGSTDDTIEIAREYGARVEIPENIESLYVETETGRHLNFGAARNLTIENATGDWLFLLDADEEVTGNADNLKAFLDNMKDEVDAIAIDFRDQKGGDTTMQFLPARIFRKGRIHYEQIVHNRAVFNEPAIFFPGLQLLHYGFGDITPEAKAAKRARTFGLLKKQLEMEPASWWCHFYLAQIYGEDQDFEKTIAASILYIEHKDEVIRFNPSIYYTLAQACLLSKNEDLADKWIGEAIRELPTDMDVACAVADYGAWRKKPHVLVTGCEMYLSAWERMRSDRLAGGSRFVYNANEQTLARVLFQLAFQRLYAGTNHLTRLKSLLQAIPDKGFAIAVEADIQREFGEIGVSWVHHGKTQNKSEANGPQKKAAKARGKVRNCKRRKPDGGIRPWKVRDRTAQAA